MSLFSPFSAILHQLLGQWQDQWQRPETEVILTEGQAPSICTAISGQVLWTICFDIFLVSSVHSSFPSPCSGPWIHWQTIRTALQPIPPAAHHPLLLVCPAHSERQAHLPETPLSLSSTGRFSRSMDSKAFCNLGFLHPPQSSPTGSKYLLSNLVKVFSAQAHKQTATPRRCSLASSPGLSSSPHFCPL